MSRIININSPLGTILTEKTEKITKRNHIRVYRKFLKEVLFYRRGSRSQGVAGNQLGLDKSIFTAKVKGKWIICINPEIVQKGGKVVKRKEGCLSIPRQSVKVPRNTHITLKYRDKDFKSNTIELYGDDARVVQHEVDHLNGKLITDYK